MHIFGRDSCKCFQLCYICIYIQEYILSYYSISIEGCIERLRYAFGRNNVGRRNAENEWTDRWMNVPDARIWKGEGDEGKGQRASDSIPIPIPVPFSFPQPFRCALCRERTTRLESIKSILPQPPLNVAKSHRSFIILLCVGNDNRRTNNTIFQSDPPSPRKPDAWFGCCFVAYGRSY